jgi:hypothetical protein
MYSYQLYDVTGATEDWNYFAQGAFGYTTEIGWDNFHPDYQDAVVDQYTGTRTGTNDAGQAERPAAQGLQESFLLAGEAAANPAYHSIISGTAPAGRTLRLHKDFQTTTSYVLTHPDQANETQGPAQLIPEHLESTLTVPASGSYVWHVNPSTRPLVLLAGGTEAWTLTCEDGAGTVLETRQVVVAIGQQVTENLGCGGPITGDSTGDGTPSGTTGGTQQGASGSTMRLKLRGHARAGRTLRARLVVAGGAVTQLRVRLRDPRGRLRARVTRVRAAGSLKLTLRSARRLTPGRYTLSASATGADGKPVAARLRVRIRRT